MALADSLLLQGRPTTDQIGWSQAWSLPQGTYGIDGHLYSKKGIGQSVAMLPFHWLARQVEGVGIVGMAHLLNVIVTAATGAILFLLVGRINGMGGGNQGFTGAYGLSALWVALCWGVGTFAIVYSKYLFNSPLVGLCLTIVVWILYELDVSNIPARTVKSVGGYLLAGLLVGVMMATRAENALLVPVFSLYLWFTRQSYSTRFARLLLFGMPIGLTTLALFAFNQARFGEPLNFGYDLSQEANGNILVGLAGFLFSPGRSLLLMIPLLLPAVWGWVRLARQAAPLRKLAWLTLGLTVVYALFFARSADWWGGWNWGIRYFLPLLPLWCVGLRGVWEYAANPGRYKVGWLIWLTVALSVAVQIPGVLVDFNAPLVADSAQGVTLDVQLWGWEHSQLVSHLRAVSAWQNWDVLAVFVQDWRLAWQPIALVILALLGLWNALLPSPNPFYQYALPLLVVVLGHWAAVPMQQAALQDPRWVAYSTDFAPLNTRMKAADASESVLLFEMLLHRPYFDRAQAWLNLGTNPVPHLQLIQEESPPPPQQRLREMAIAEALWVYVAVEESAIGDPNSATERWMSERAYYVGTEWLSERTRLSMYVTQGDVVVESAGVNLSDNISLREIKVSPMAQAGTPLLIELAWSATGIPERNYTVFVQLIAPDGTPAVQQDTPPSAGFTPTTSWSAGTVVIDRRALNLPNDLASGNYRLIVGMYDENGARLPVATGGDFVDVGIVEVSPGS